MTIRQRHFIDSHKGATPVFVLACMGFYDSWDNVTAWAYLATHGSYGLLWVLKSRAFPDKQWEQPCGLPYGLLIWAGLSLYWIAPWLITSADLVAPPWLLGLAVATWGIGIFFHFASDMQKDIQLKLKKGLIQTGLWSKCRNPNYFGELLIYAGFSCLAMHWIPLGVLALFVAVVWFPNMIKKDKSLSRYDEFADYKARSKMFIPYIF